MKLIDALRTFSSTDVVVTDGYDCIIEDYLTALDGTDDAEKDVCLDYSSEGVWKVIEYDESGFRLPVAIFFVMKADSYREMMQE